ncbi:hypothetical protein [Nocardia bovistercoris]|uniref:Uncharacterized protein n=1 Tax=Nocardia bovistercoris TaxID=2785916 RepID=A0A931N405_9NOCA|nr:hypothetical protein [Nocardia bovistercoris]MBH0778339.1 hypothetical protein [Nocardia bovistercoris]
MQYPVGAGPTPRPPVPEDVRTARQLWWAVAAFGVVQLTASLVVASGQRDELADEAFETLRASDPTATEATADLMVIGVFGLAAIAGVIITAFALLFIHFFWRGKLWARTLLTFVGVWLVIIGVATLFALESVDGIAALVAGGAAIVQGVLAGGALYLGHRPDSNAYFLMNRR